MRKAVTLLVLLFALSAAPALAQDGPFTPILPPTPTPTAIPTVAPTKKPADDNGPARNLLFGIAGALAFIFTGIGIYISRDARKSLTDADRRKLDREQLGIREELTPEQKHQQRLQKQRARKKTKAQKRARKVQRGKR